MEVERGPYKATILHIGPLISFHVNLGEGRLSGPYGPSDGLLGGLMGDTKWTY